MTPAVGDAIWVWPPATPHEQAVAAPTGFQYSATPTSPSLLLPPNPWDLTSPIYPPGKPYQAAPHFHQPSPDTPHDHIQPPTPQQILTPWFPQSPISPEIDQHQQFQMQQSYPHNQQQQNEGPLKLLISWRKDHFPLLPPQTPYAGTHTPPNIPWGIPTASTATPAATSTRTGDRERNININNNNKLCTTIRIALSSSLNDPLAIRCSPNTAIVAFGTHQNALQAFRELGYLEHLSVRFPFNNEDLVNHENSPSMRDCMHTHQEWHHHHHQHPQQQQQGYYDPPAAHHEPSDLYNHDQNYHNRGDNTRQYEQTGPVINAPSSPRRKRRGGIRQSPQLQLQLQLLPPLPVHQSQQYIPSPLPPPPPPPSLPQTQPQFQPQPQPPTTIPTTTATEETMTSERRGSAATVLVVDSSFGRHAQDECIQQPGSGAIGISTGNASVFVVNGSVDNSSGSSRSHNIGHVPG